MAQPFFNSNYGSSLMRVDNSGIQQAGQAYGQMFANLGKIAADSIDKYAEGKKKKEEQKQTASVIKKFLINSPDTAAQFGIKGDDSITFEQAVEQGANAISKNPKGLEMFKNLQAMANQQQQNEILLDKFNREGKEREANTLFSQYQMGTKTGAVPPLATITDPVEYAREAQRVSNIENNPFLTNRLAEGLPTRVTQAQTLGTARKKLKTEKKEKRFSNESSLRKEVRGSKIIKDFDDVRTAFGKVKSAAGDLALVFNYMKILDPGSVVREGEFKSAADATSWLQKSEDSDISIPKPVAQAIRKFKDGTLLNANQREDFFKTARNITAVQFKPAKELLGEYKSIAKMENLRVENVIPQNYLQIEQELAQDIDVKTQDNTDEVDDASERARQSTPSATPPPPSQPSQGRQSAQNIILQKAQRGELLTPKEQQILDLLQKKQAQSINP